MRRSKLTKSVTALAAVAAGAGSVLAGAPAAEAAATGAGLKLAAADDTYVSSGRKDATFGAEQKLAIGRLAGDSKTAFLKFVVPAGTEVTGARLTLATVGGVTGRLTLNRVADTAWTERKLTSATAPALGAVVGTAAPKADAAEVSFDLGATVTGPGAYAFALRSSASSAVTRFRAAEGRTGGPLLLVATGTTEAPVTAPVDEPTPAEPVTPPADEPVAPAQPATPIEDEDMPPPPAPATGDCVTGKLLVPSCGVLWGAAAGGFTDAPRDAALKDWEKLSGRTASIFHTYHKGDEPFPTRSEMAMARDAAHPRVLLMNWKIAYGSSWAKVARGEQDARIDRFAARVKATFPEKFFLVLNHEPENDVNPRAGSGWEAKDFAAMYRHTIERLRAKGVTNAINVMAYMGNEKWMAQSWWKDLYPGDDVVDWMGLDSYVSAEKGYYHYGMFADLLDRKAPNGPSFYDWATTKHPAKPLMVAEWGVYHRVGKVTDKTAGFKSVLPELKKRPNIKAIVYFDTSHDDQGDRDISIDSTKANLAAFRTLAADKIFDVTLR
ncbi:DNRLRE domain-containing protein [Couchioplanes caeruleus]|uniref:CBM96 family carbohydrate-binding protein n=1 Tax=Couchioplanes caeruleus TaxID=56438 RepID=UPI0020BF06C0|nr:DNRLRE domain-containing protein [Couchioplanes caeruleus]UQU61301.1 DNRLRE domain-containing protein [Couchioplanes caeruleus]